MINVVCGIRSTGRICTDLADALTDQGHTVKIAYGRFEVPYKYKKYAHKIGTDLDVKLHGVRARLLDESGFGSKRATIEFIKWVRKFDPDVIHLHNIHGYYINIEVLFDYLRTCGKKIIWTLHDCWAFTGHAAYCEAANCTRWKNGCHDCPKKNDYPVSYFDNSKRNWLKKRKIFTSVPSMQIVTPSKWLAKIVKQSYLKKYPVNVIYNGIDTSVFKPVDSSELRQKLNLGNKRVILGVAAIWDQRKGLDDFIKLNKLIDHTEYQIILVGLTEKQIDAIPKNMIGIQRTNSVNQLVELYSLAHVFVNPTYEDNYPTTNLEAIACGTPVITYDTGGSSESANSYGIFVTKGTITGIYDAIEDYKFSVKSNVELHFSAAVKEYINLINETMISSKAKKRVLYVTNLPAPYKIDLFEAMSKELDLTVIYERHTATNRDEKWKNNNKRSFEEIYLNGKEIGEESSFAPSIIKYLKHNKYDGIIMNGYSSPTTMIAISYLRFMRIPFIIACDGAISKSSNRIKNQVKKFFVCSATYWLCSSRATKEQLVRLGADINRCMIYPFTSLTEKDFLYANNKLLIDKKIYKKKLGVAEKSMILSVGRFSYDNGYGKGYDMLLKAAEKLDKDIGIYIVGDNPTDEFLKWKLKKSLTNVHFIGFKTKEELSDYYAAADIFVLMTRGDVWGLVINEAMMYHLPVITTDKCGAGNELVKNGINGFIVPVGDENELIRKINALIHNSFICNKNGNNSAMIIRCYTIEKMAHCHIESLRKAMKW